MLKWITIKRMEKILSGQQRRRQQKMNPYKFTSFQTDFGAKIQIQGVPTSFGKEFSKRRKICESLFTFLTNFLACLKKKRSFRPKLVGTSRMINSYLPVSKVVYV